MYKAPGRSRERILTFGVGGVGKSRALLTIARALPQHTFYIVDNDNAYDRLLETEFSDLSTREEYLGREMDNTYCDEDGNLVLFRVSGWEDNVWALHEALRRAKRDDWVAIDSLTTLWDDVQTWWVEKVYGNEMDRYLLELKLAQKEKGGTHTAAEGLFMDWAYLNPQYSEAVTKKIINAHCHMYMTAEQVELTTLDKDKGVRGLYGPYGVKPKGQKRSGHNSQTVLLLTKSRFDEFAMTTVKDRGREQVEDRGVDDFFEDYLVKVGGWRMEKGERDRKVGVKKKVKKEGEE